MSKQQQYPKKSGAALVWFRRDLRADDHAALYHALKNHAAVYTAFVFDTDILHTLPVHDRRVEFIWHSVQQLNDTLRGAGGELLILHGSARSRITDLAQRLKVTAVYANEDYEPDAIARDVDVAHTLDAQGVTLHLFKDQVVFDKSEVVKPDGGSYSVFTPYYKRWLSQLQAFHYQAYPCERYMSSLSALDASQATLVDTLSELDALGFKQTDLLRLFQPLGGVGTQGAQALYQDFLTRMHAYHQKRDYPARKGVSYLSVHLRFGTISIRQLVRAAMERISNGCEGAAIWLKELAWRDFYAQSLYHSPHVVSSSFKPAYDAVQWEAGEHADQLFDAWCRGQTGYPIVDAAMRQLNATGFMHNRLRMIVASFLTKDLGIDWRRGEAYFALKLNDFDLASNNGGWQWAASTGCDAQPYFRIFNPTSQSKKFDANGDFIRKYVPELAALGSKSIHAPWLCKPEILQAANVCLGDARESDASEKLMYYPLPIVDHAIAREQTLQRYKTAVKAPSESK